MSDDDLDRNHAALHDLFGADAFAASIDARLTAWGGGWSRVELSVDDRHANFAGWLHGAAVFGVGDAAFAVACNSWGRFAVALSVDIHFLASPPVGNVLVAEARERHRTKRTGAYLIEVSHDDQLVASLHALAHRTDRWLLGEDAWSDDWRATH